MYARVLLGDPSSPDHEFRSGNSGLISVNISLDKDQKGSSCDVQIFDPNGVYANEYYTIIFDDNGLEPPTIDLSRYQRILPETDEDKDAVAKEAVSSISDVESSPIQGENVNPNVKAGQQISVELGNYGTPFLRYAFINDSIDYDHQTRVIKFGGTVASKVAAQTPVNTAYQELTFKQYAETVAEKHGLKVALEGDINPTYEYFPQIGLTDYEALLQEAKRLGYQITTKNDTMVISKAEITEDDEGEEKIYDLVYGSNLSSISFTYKVEPAGSNGVRSSLGSDNTTGFERKWEINDDGLIEPIRQEIEKPEDDSTISTTGSAIAPVKPSETDNEESEQKENEKRVKGIQLDTKFTFDELSSKLDPTWGLRTTGLKPEVLNRVWLCDSVKYGFRGNIITVHATAYSPLKPKYKEVKPPPSSTSGGFSAEGLPPGLEGSYNDLIMKSYQQMGGFSSASGPGRGRVACVWAINRIAENAGFSNLWNQSLNVEFALNTMRNSQYGRRVPIGQEIPGDITMVLRGSSGGHIGLVTGKGRAISNSSSQAKFVWNSDLFFSASYSGAQTREVWRDVRTFNT